MASEQANAKKYLDPGAGRGPEYYVPTTAKDTTVPVLDSPDPDYDKPEDAPPVVGEDAPDITDQDISREEELEAAELGGEEWSEDKAQNEPLPGEVPDLLPEERERLPSDRNG